MSTHIPGFQSFLLFNASFFYWPPDRTRVKDGKQTVEVLKALSPGHTYCRVPILRAEYLESKSERFN